MMSSWCYCSVADVAAAAAAVVVSVVCLLALVAFDAFECMLRGLARKYAVSALATLC